MFTLGLLLASSVVASGQAQATFPGSAWERRDAEKLGLDAAALDRIAEELGGRGCIVKDGYLAKTWGDQAEVGDWYSSAKPVLSTLLFFALQEGRVTSVDQPIADFGWPLQAKDQGITFRHLGAMTSGYARPEGPGEAWAYNDFAIQLYQKTRRTKSTLTFSRRSSSAKTPSPKWRITSLRPPSGSMPGSSPRATALLSQSGAGKPPSQISHFSQPAAAHRRQIVVCPGGAHRRGSQGTCRSAGRRRARDVRAPHLTPRCLPEPCSPDSPRTNCRPASP